MILQKVISSTGVASRRQAEELIRRGQVKINGRVAELGERADATKDKITIKNRLIPSAPGKIYVKLNKPLDYTCTNRVFKGEKNIFSLINIPQKLFAVGRLDKDSRGLVLLTNDGDLTQRLAHPRFKHEKIYEVKVRGEIKKPDLIIKKLVGGIDIGEDDGIARAKQVNYLQDNLFVITLTEGKKRQIRRMFQFLGLTVIDLRRVGLAGLGLGDLKEGRFSYLSKEELNKLKI